MKKGPRLFFRNPQLPCFLIIVSWNRGYLINWHLLNIKATICSVLYITKVSEKLSKPFLQTSVMATDIESVFSKVYFPKCIFQSVFSKVYFPKCVFADCICPDCICPKCYFADICDGHWDWERSWRKGGLSEDGRV